MPGRGTGHGWVMTTDFGGTISTPVPDPEQEAAPPPAGDGGERRGEDADPVPSGFSDPDTFAPEEDAVDSGDSSGTA